MEANSEGNRENYIFVLDHNCIYLHMYKKTYWNNIDADAITQCIYNISKDNNISISEILDNIKSQILKLN